MRLKLLNHVCNLYLIPDTLFYTQFYLINFLYLFTIFIFFSQKLPTFKFENVLTLYLLILIQFKPFPYKLAAFLCTLVFSCTFAFCHFQHLKPSTLKIAFSILIIYMDYLYTLDIKQITELLFVI